MSVPADQSAELFTAFLPFDGTVAPEDVTPYETAG